MYFNVYYMSTTLAQTSTQVHVMNIVFNEKWPLRKE